MKKILYNLMLLTAIAAVFSACHPVNKLYDAIGPVPTPNGTPQTFTLTLAAADYGLLPPTNYAKTSLNFKTKDDATSSIPVILSSKYPNYADKSSVLVTYAVPPVTVAVADSVFKDVAYTLVDPTDYLLLPGNKFSDFSASQILAWLPYKYPTPVANQLAVLTFIYYESGATATVTQSFLYLNGAWKKIYTISAAQYSSIGKGGTSNNFASADAGNLTAYFNTFLKADAAVAAIAKAGDVQYISFKYYGGSAVKTYQRVMPLTFDGANWVTASLPQSLTFARTAGVWVADNTVNYTLAAADYTYIGTTTAGSDAARANVAQYGDFNITTTGAATSWTDADLQAAIIAVLAHKYPAAVANQKFVITYAAYNGATINVTKTYNFDGTTFVLVINQ
jgi:hypothetical protein